jgi:hypothetical protein
VLRLTSAVRALAAQTRLEHIIEVLSGIEAATASPAITE